MHRRLLVGAVCVGAVLLAVAAVARQRQTGASARPTNSSMAQPAHDYDAHADTIDARSDLPAEGAPAAADAVAIEAYEFSARDPSLFAEIDKAVVDHVKEAALDCASEWRRRSGSSKPDMVRFTPTISFVATERRARLESVLSARWPAYYDDPMRACLLNALDGFEYNTTREYRLVVALPIVIRGPTFRVPETTDDGPH